MKTITTSAIAVIGLAAGAVGLPAQAETVWHYPYKGLPYATQSTPTVSFYRAPPRYGAYRLYRHPAREKACR